jgi:hypothetical protein
MIASILTRVTSLTARAAAAAPPERDSIGLELDGLAAVMESHFRYEERAISDALDRETTGTDWSDQVFRFHPRTP